MEWAHTLNIKCEWLTLDREKTPPVNPKANKGRPQTARNVRLTTAIKPSSDGDDNERDYNNDGLPTTKRTSSSKQPRGSVMNRMLRDKKERDSTLDSEVAIRKKIFGIYICEERCPNFKGCCFELRRTKQHHKVTTVKQDEWAKAVVSDVRGATLDQPPTDGIAKYGY